MKWIVTREDEPNVFTPVTGKIADTKLVKGEAIWDDGFAEEGSEWGDEESAAISAKQTQWQMEDEFNRAHACTK